MMNTIDIQVDEKAKSVAKAYLRSESELLDLVQKVDSRRIFMKLHYSSLHDYACRRLKLSESVASNLINVARKAVMVPELKEAVASGEITVATARKIVPVLNPANQSEWIEAAKTLKKTELEHKVAQESPFAKTPERLKPVAKNRVFFSCGVSDEVAEKIRRVQDLVSKKQNASASLEVALGEMADAFLERHDPIVRAERIARRKAQGRAERSDTVDSASVCPGQTEVPTGRQISPEKPAAMPSYRTPIPKEIIHAVNIRDRGQCTFVHEGHRCPNRRFLHFHHKIPLALGGKHTVENVVTLCSTHHEAMHLKRPGAPGRPGSVVAGPQANPPRNS